MKKDFFERIIIIVIILAVIQVFLDEWSRYEHWSALARNSLIIAGILFDIIFSIEFASRFTLAYKRNKVSRYWKYERGWIDFLSSIPLLLLNLPAVYLILSGNPEEGAAASALYNFSIIFKDMKFTRILRFVRLVKIFGKLPKAGSPMAKHHISVVSTTVVCTIIFTLAVFSLLSSARHQKELERTHFFDNLISTVKYLESKSGISYNDVAEKMFGEQNNLLKLTYKNEIIISRITEEKLNKYFAKEDYSSVNNRGFILYFSLVDLNREEAYNNIIFFLIIVFIFLSVIFLYGRHFASTVTDVINTIVAGFRSRQHNKNVKIRDEFNQDEVYKLAKFYNDIYLPAKSRRINKEEHGRQT
ncbi:MAG: hypothetical protein JXN64_13535 [Spirochaetes bacterium]|nr:hypothetical protein [Spirochaetota bacterium]